MVSLLRYLAAVNHLRTFSGIDYPNYCGLAELVRTGSYFNFSVVDFVSGTVVVSPPVAWPESLDEAAFDGTGFLGGG